MKAKECRSGISAFSNLVVAPRSILFRPTPVYPVMLALSGSKVAGLEVFGCGEGLTPTSIYVLPIAAQGYDVHTSEYFQDNQSAMKMEKNGRQLAGQKSRHINIRYFFIKDCIDSGEINLLYCPTGEMLGDDFFSKPQHGSPLFRRFRDVIMGIAHHEEIRATKAPNQERVGDRDLEAKVSTYLRAENQNVMSEAASEMVVPVPKQTKPRGGVTWATIVRWPKTAGHDHLLSPSGQMFKLEKQRT